MDVAFSPVVRLLATSSDDSTIRIWSMDSGKCIYKFTGHKSDANSIDFSSCGRYLVSCSDDTTIKLWDL